MVTASIVNDSDWDDCVFWVSKNARVHPFPTHSDLNDVPHIFSTQVEPVHGTYAQNGSRVTQFANACNIFCLCHSIKVT